ncbi:hypothetical protein C2127_27825 [Pseudomonas aeruginosa]|nr:hypothetical protein C2127_27825 [Pseudomonas aeruginosa]
MAIEKGEAFARRDIYIDYDFEDVTYRWDHRQGTIHVRFYGEAEPPEPVEHDNRLFNDALRFGREITREEYETGFPKG